MWWLLACEPTVEKPEKTVQIDSSIDSQVNSETGTTTELPDDDVGYANCFPDFTQFYIEERNVTSVPLLPVANGYVAAAYATKAKQVPVTYNDGSTGLMDQSHSMVAFWDHPMRNPTPTTVSEDRLWDLYPGVKIDGVGTWMNTVNEEQTGYELGTGILRIVQVVDDIEVTSRYFTPFQEGGERDLVTIVTLKNIGTLNHTVDLYSLQNAHVDGEGSAHGEQISKDDRGILETGKEGSFLHRPLGEALMAAASGGATENPWNRLSKGEDLGGELLSGDDVAVGFEWKLGTLGAGEEMTRGWVLSWGEEGESLKTRVDGWLGTKDAETILTQERENWHTWHSAENIPKDMHELETLLYLTSTATLRMAQVRGEGAGQILASLPPGIWNITWPRDQTYATLALAATGHTAEAEAAVRFVLNGKAGTYANYLGLSDYLVSAARYYGDGTEESDGATCPDGSDAGPNIELDDFGLFLRAWEATPGLKAESEAAVTTGVVEPLTSLIQTNGLLAADSSIWERHWNNCFPNGRKQFAWSSIQAAAGLAALGNPDADRLRSGLLTRKSDGGPVGEIGTCPYLASSPEELCDGCGGLDASGVELINLGLVRPESALARGTISAMMGLRASSGGFRRNDDGSGSSNPYPWYDDQEWIFIDLQMAMAMKKVGDATGDATLLANAEIMLSHVTEIGGANYGLFPELVSDGIWTSEDDADHYNLGKDGGQEAQGAMPMIGFGAGMYLLTLEAMR